MHDNFYIKKEKQKNLHKLTLQKHARKHVFEEKTKIMQEQLQLKNPKVKCY